MSNIKTALKETLSKKKKIDSSNYLLLVTIGLFIAMYIAGCIIFHAKGFGKTQIFLNMLIDNAGLMIAAAGMTIVMITGGIDISVGSMVCFVCMFLSYTMERMHMASGLSIILVLLIGIAFGAFQGWLVAYMKLQPFIVTLAGLFFCRGMAAVISSDQISIKANQVFLHFAELKINLPFGGYTNRAGKYIAPFIHPSVVIALLTMAIIWYMLKYTRFGRNLFAIGGSEQSALLMGINVNRTKFIAYMLEGFLAALAGLVFCLNTTSGFVEQARGFEMDAISSAVIGGTLLTGGVGTIVGTFFGVLIKATIETLIRSQGTLSSWWNKIVLSAILCFFIVLQSIFTIVKERKSK